MLEMTYGYVINDVSAWSLGHSYPPLALKTLKTSFLSEKGYLSVSSLIVVMWLVSIAIVWFDYETTIFITDQHCRQANYYYNRHFSKTWRVAHVQRTECRHKIMGCVAWAETSNVSF
jgi:hypothetical protein